jgi:hypothetical protein
MQPFILLSVFLLVTPAAAQGWQKFLYPGDSFSVSLPAAPSVDTTTYQATPGRTVPARIYTLRRDDAEFKVTVAELGDHPPEEEAVIGEAVRTLSAGGEVKVDITYHINRVCGRQLSIVQGDGARVSVALFDFNGRLYQIEGRSLPGGGNATADTIRFVQSMTFTGDGTNRPDEQSGTLADARNSLNAAGAAGPGAEVGAGPDEPRSRKQLFAALRSTLAAGDLPAAQSAWESLSELPRFGNNHGNSSGPFVQAMNQIGAALRNGDLGGAQQALSALRQRSRDGGGRLP